MTKLKSVAKRKHSFIFVTLTIREIINTYADNTLRIHPLD